MLWTVIVSGIADLVTSLPESIQQWQKRKKIKLEDREKREEAQTTAVRILLEVRSVERAENMARDAAAITSRNKLRLLFDGVMCARALEAKGQGANRKEEEMYTGVRKQNERTLSSPGEAAQEGPHIGALLEQREKARIWRLCSHMLRCSRRLLEQRKRRRVNSRLPASQPPSPTSLSTSRTESPCAKTKEEEEVNIFPASFSVV